MTAQALQVDPLTVASIGVELDELITEIDEIRRGVLEQRLTETELFVRFLGLCALVNHRYGNIRLQLHLAVGDEPKL